MGFRIDVSVILWIQLLVLSGYLHSLTSRFFLNLRNIAHHQRQTTIGTRAAVPTVAAPRARSARKQSGRPTTDFIVETFMDKTTHNNETDSNEGAIQQADIFHLEVLTSRS